MRPCSSVMDRRSSLLARTPPVLPRRRSRSPDHTTCARIGVEVWYTPRRGEPMRRPVLSTLGAKVDPSRACVLVIDVQNEFCARSGAFHRTGHDVDRIEAMVPNLLEFIDRARAAGCPVIFVRAIYDEHFLAPNWRDPDILCDLTVPRCRT